MSKTPGLTRTGRLSPSWPPGVVFCDRCRNPGIGFVEAEPGQKLAVHEEVEIRSHRRCGRVSEQTEARIGVLPTRARAARWLPLAIVLDGGAEVGDIVGKLERQPGRRVGA